MRSPYDSVRSALSIRMPLELLNRVAKNDVHCVRPRKVLCWLSPTRDPLLVVLGVAELAAVLLAEFAFLVKVRGDPVATSLRCLEVTDSDVVPSQRPRQHGPSSTSEV